MPVRSKHNNRLVPLAGFGFPNDNFIGEPELTAGASAISVTIYVSTLTTLNIGQSPDKSNYYYFQDYVIQPNKQYVIQVPCALEFYRITILNQSQTQQQYCYMVTSLVQQLTQGVDIRPLDSATDSVSVSNFPNQQLVAGENSNFAFYPTSSNNTAAIYADETKGTDVAGGWQYNNINNDGKINWYIYNNAASPATDYKVSQLNSMYAVVNNLSTLGLAQAQNPWVMIYTRPDSGTNSAFWYKSKLFFGSNAHTDISGIKLLYTGTDPSGVHPEITGINRIQLLYVSALSDNKLLANVQNENIMLGTLQTTDNTSPANSFSFVMQEFGADWVKTQSVLPIENGAVQVGGAVNLTPALNTATYNQAVAAVDFSGTAYDMGENSLLDVLLLGTGITNGSVRLDYSTDNVSWFPNNTTTYSITTTDPHYVILGLKTGSRYVRVSTGGASTFRATNLKMTFSSKRN